MEQGTLLFLSIAALLTGGVIGVVVYRMVRSLLEKQLKATEERQRSLFQEEREREQELVDEKLKQGTQALEHKKDIIKEMVDAIRKELSESQKRLESSEKARIGEFSTMKTAFEEYKMITRGLQETTDDLKNILSNNQLRGKFGEEVAEGLLQSVGFVKGQQYTKQESQSGSSARPDFTIYLPDRTKVNVDVKFPYQSLIRYQEVEGEQEKERHLRAFASDVKEKIKQVATRDYINPQEGTVDFVILFVPNEMIFSFIYDQLNEVWNDAMRKKVIMAGPFSFTAILRMIFQAYKNFSYQQNLHEIIQLIKTFEKEYEKFSGALDTLGSRIQSAANQYQTVSVTRTKKLTGIVEKIKQEDMLGSGEEDDNEALPPVSAHNADDGEE